ncbi:MAG: fibrobacter succinogenes major paralogous domain-containing protein, partial [Bacteroidota bacterium]
YFHDDPAEGVKYGKLYNWYAVNDARGLAPVGYHIPSDAEWTTLADSLGGAEYAGTKMKSTRGWEGYGCMRCDGKSTEFKKTCTACKGTSIFAYQTNSTMPFSGNGSNSSGFTGLPGGGRYDDGSIFGGYGGWWSSSEDASEDVWVRSLDSRFSHLNRFDPYKGYGFSVRCLRD